MSELSPWQIFFRLSRPTRTRRQELRAPSGHLHWWETGNRILTDGVVNYRMSGIPQFEFPCRTRGARDKRISKSARFADVIFTQSVHRSRTLMYRSLLDASSGEAALRNVKIGIRQNIASTGIALCRKETPPEGGGTPHAYECTPRFRSGRRGTQTQIVGNLQKLHRGRSRKSGWD